MAKTPPRPDVSFGLLVAAMAAVLAGMLFLPPRWQDILLVTLIALSAVLFTVIIVFAYRVRATGPAGQD